jgi:1-acyl-sn-glycerol-3-phosphate acyltransferase
VKRESSEPIYATAVSLGLTLFRALRVRRRVTGLENIPPQGGAVIAMTHFGYLEFALVEWVIWLHNKRHVRFMAKQSVFDKPVVGGLLRGMRHIPVDLKAGAAAYSDAVAALQRGELVGIFPEAGVSASFTVRELKTGAARLAAEAGVPLVPVAVWGGQRLMTKDRSIGFRERIGVRVNFLFGRPITVSPNEDVREVTDNLRTTLQEMVNELQETYPTDGTGQWWQPKHRGGTAPTPEEAAAADAERERRRTQNARA